MGEGQVSVEAVTGCGYFNTKSAWWETGTIYDFKGKKEMKSAHAWSISPNGRLFLWETLCEGGADENIAKCQTQLENEIAGKSPSNLSINVIVADPAQRV